MIEIIRKNKKKFFDLFINIFASLILSVTSQFLVYPLLAHWMDIAEYGKMLSVMGVANISISLGTALNNCRMIIYGEYKSKGIKGDFNILLFSFALPASLICFFLSLFYFQYSSIHSIMLAVLVSMMIVKQYYVVEYRLALSFIKILLCNAIACSGFAVGLLLYYFGVSYWPLVFICSEAFSIVFILFTSKVWKEPFSKTVLFGKTLTKSLILLISIFAGTALTYFDKLFLFPTLGAEAVSVYNVASYLGKALAILMNPIASVLLSYFVQDGFKLSKKYFLVFDCTIFILCCLFTVIVFFVSPFITKFLYPDIYDLAKDYFLIANASSVFIVGNNLLQTAILKKAPTYFQIIKEFLFATVYVALSFILMKSYGLFGFCVAALTANLFKYFLITFLGLITYRKGPQNEQIQTEN